MRILILHNQPVWPNGHPDAESDHEVVFTSEVVADHLMKAGHSVSRLDLGRDPAVLVAAVKRFEPEVWFTLLEGWADQGEPEPHAVGLPAWLGVPYTGRPSPTLCLPRRKPLAKRLFRGAGLPTPEFFVVEALPVPES